MKVVVEKKIHKKKKTSALTCTLIFDTDGKLVPLLPRSQGMQENISYIVQICY